MIKPGTWWIKSESDPRWDASGKSSAVGGFTHPREVTEHIEKVKKRLGEPPKDLEYGYFKY